LASAPLDAERFVKTVRTEWLDHFVIFGERHLRHLIEEIMGHYLNERYHQGIGSQIIRPKPSPRNDNTAGGAMGCRSRLGGLPSAKRTTGGKTVEKSSRLTSPSRKRASRSSRGVNALGASESLFEWAWGVSRLVNETREPQLRVPSCVAADFSLATHQTAVRSLKNTAR
jgi:hypothetical protein